MEGVVLDPVKLSDADDAFAVGAAKVGLDGILRPPGVSMPRVIDATFLR
jgi:hypothetical protein